MSNPWLKKNPFMSMWLSSAHSIANTARAHATSAVKRESAAAVNKATKDMFGLWTGALPAARTTKRRKKR